MIPMQTRSLMDFVNRGAEPAMGQPQTSPTPSADPSQGNMDPELALYLQRMQLLQQLLQGGQ